MLLVTFFSENSYKLQYFIFGWCWSMYHPREVIFNSSTHKKMTTIMFQVNNRNTRKMCKICWKLIIKIPKWPHWCCSDVFFINFNHILHICLVFLLLTLRRQTFAWMTWSLFCGLSILHCHREQHGLELAKFNNKFVSKNDTTINLFFHA